MRDFKPVFKELESNIRRAKWFTDDWDIYNRGVYMQVYKRNWYNDGQGGIHFETYVEKPQLEDKTVPIHMHVEDEFPEQEAFIRRFIEKTRATISGWKGFKVYGTGYLVCQRVLPLDPQSLSGRLLEEFGKLQQLSPMIDETITEVVRTT